MKKSVFIPSLFIATICIAQHYEPNWSRFNTRGIPSWFKEAKFGIFIHWGVYAVPSYAPVIENSGESYAEWYWYRINEGQQILQTISR
jgi:alpha-L-fucosidase